MGVCESVCWIYICTECIFVLSFPDPANLKQAVIPSISTRGMQQEYRTTIKISPGADCTEISCPCGRPQVSGLPDAHLIAHAEAAGHEPRELLLHRDTVQGWREQYPLDFEFVVPSRQEVFANDKMKDGEKVPKTAEGVMSVFGCQCVYVHFLLLFVVGWCMPVVLCVAGEDWAW